MAWTDEELDGALDGRVAAILFDDEGNAGIAAIFAGPAAGDFARERLQQV